jgi:hypothetical protein
VLKVRVGRASRDEKVPDSLLDVKPCLGATEEAKALTPERVLEGEIAMSASAQKVTLARLQARREQIECELARLEREIVRASSQVLAVQERITSLTPGRPSEDSRADQSAGVCRC